MIYPPVDIVDEHDNVIGAAMVAEVWSKGYRHRGVCIVAEDSVGRILIQKRASSMLLYPDCWDISAAGHVDTGMTYDEAAFVEVAEELGVQNANLELIGNYYIETRPDGRNSRRFVNVYRVRMGDTPLTLGKSEVSEVKWVTPAELRELVTNHPDQVAETLQLFYPRLFA